MSALGPALALLVALVGAPRSGSASDRVDIDGWLRKPGVRLLALEFYSLDCKPCLRAMPDWQKLVRRYNREGLRFVVVRDANDGRCPTLPWTPDEAWCDDEDGRLQKRFGVKALPSAFLWNWRGELLVKDNAHIDAVARAIKAHSRSATRALIVAPGADASLVALLRDEMRRAGKIDVIAGPEDGALFRKLHKQYSRMSRGGGGGRCAVDEPLPPNAVLKATLHGRKTRWLSVELSPLRAGSCKLLSSGRARWQPDHPQRSAAEAVTGLLDGLRLPRPQMPAGSAVPPHPPPPHGGSGPVFGGGEAKPTVGRLRVEGSPRGARVEVSGPDDFTRVVSMPRDLDGLAPGKYTVKVSASGHVAREVSKQVEVDLTALVQVRLDRLGGLRVEGTPVGAVAEVYDADGARLAARPLPLTGNGLAPGEYRIKVTRPGYGGYDARHKVTAGQVATVKVALARASAATSSGRSGVVWVRLPGGTFDMGSRSGDPDEKPVHRVTVSSFEMAQSEVTVGQYRACVRAGACTAPATGEYCNWGKSGREDHPVNCVDWSQAVAFSGWVGGRLPTEAEWEYAARSGGRSWTHPWGNEEASCARAVVGHPRSCTSSDPCGCGRNSTWPVCSKSSGHTRHGLCDMIGNVWEWTGDWYGKYSSGHQRDPKGASGGSSRVNRGCGWRGSASYCRAAGRFFNSPSFRNGYLGFRPTRSVP